MKTIHLVYTVPPPQNRILRKIDHYLRKSGVIPPFHRWGILSKIDWPKPIYAPHSITFNLLKAFQKIGVVVRLYDWTEHTKCNLKKDDILLFHPRPTSTKAQTRPDQKSIGWRTATSNPSTKKYIIIPYNHDPRQTLWLKPFFKHQITGFITISGKYWSDTWQQSPLKNDLLNIDALHIRMAIDASEYPVVKKKFNPPGKRKFLYVGSTGYPKNTEELENIAAKCPNFQGGYISRGEIKGWKKIANFANLTPEYMSKLAEEYDIFINTSEFDAQATTVLEQMCFGLPIACTPETGYVHQSIIKLDVNDTQFNCKQVQLMQGMPTEDLINLAKKNREIAETVYNWDLFTKEVINFINI